MDAIGEDTLQSYFGEYSTSTKAYRTQGCPDVFFREVTNFLLEVAYMNLKTY